MWRCFGVLVFVVVCSYCAQLPNLVLVVADDLGWNDVGYHQVEGVTTNNVIATPTLDELAYSGIRLEQHYAQTMCSPTRGALMTSRYPSHTGLGPYVIKTSFPYAMPSQHAFLPELLHSGGYRTHLVGKWHLGFCDERYTPTFRGFDSFLGYLSSDETYYSHISQDGGFSGYDFRNGSKPNVLSPVALNCDGVYSTYLLSAESVRLIQEHSKNYGNGGLFLFLSFQSVHDPLEVPKEFTEPYNAIDDMNRRLMAGMITAMDQAIKNVTDALKANGMWNNTILIFSSDNGGANSAGANNYPLRGNKTSNWEGGIRVPAFLSGPGSNISPSLTGSINNNLFHVVDWMPSLLTAANLPSPSFEIDGVDQWNSLTQGTIPPRDSVIFNMPPQSDGLSHGAIRVGKWKLIIESSVKGSVAFAGTPRLPPAGFIPPEPDVPPLPTQGLWLFNIEEDPNETTNLANEYPGTTAALLRTFKEQQIDCLPDLYTTHRTDSTCDPAQFHDQWTPWSNVPNNNCTYV
ncbi:sulfatase 1 precursor [Pelomyxa schiedti]|nr:sulfatase 1 precursor [Pelomyxa schiedti]